MLRSFASHHVSIAVCSTFHTLVGYALAHVHDANVPPPPRNRPVLGVPPSHAAAVCLFIHDVVATASDPPGGSQGLRRALLEHLLSATTLPAALVATTGHDATTYRTTYGFKPQVCDDVNTLASYSNNNSSSNPGCALLMTLPAPPTFSLHPPTRALILNPNGGSTNPIRLPSAMSKAIPPHELNPRTTHYVTPSTHGFRSLAKTSSLFPTLAPGKRRVVVDIGCSTGETTRMLAKHIPAGPNCVVVGIDRGSKCIQECRALSNTEQEKQIQYFQIDVVTFPHLLAEEIASFHADECVIFLDIGGDRMADTVVGLTDYLFLHVAPVLVVIKSEEMWKSLAEWREPPDIHDRPDVSTGRDIPWGRAKRTIKDMPPPTKWAEAKRGGGDKRGSMHPMQAPIRTSPVSGLSICRFWSYSVCKKFEHRGKPGAEKFGDCELDHETCHVCLVAGHKALQCEEWLKQLRTLSL